MDYGCSKDEDPDIPEQAIWAKQREERGFDNTETWNLEQTIASFVIPRLEVFKELHASHPVDMTSEQWNEIIQKMIDGFKEVQLRYDEHRGYGLWNVEKINEGMNLFAKYYIHLGW